MWRIRHLREEVWWTGISDVAVKMLREAGISDVATSVEVCHGGLAFLTSPWRSIGMTVQLTAGHMTWDHCIFTMGGKTRHKNRKLSGKKQAHLSTVSGGLRGCIGWKG